MTFAEKMLELFKSRKFQIAASTSVTALISGIQAGQSWLTIVCVAGAPWIALILAMAQVDSAKVVAAARMATEEVDKNVKRLSEAEAKKLVEAVFAKLAVKKEV